MAKARSRTTTRKVKDRWKAKNWYNILAPPSFDNVTVADTLADGPDNLINRITGVSLADLTNDFRKSHIVLYFQVKSVEENNAHTQFIGHTLTSDYLRRLIRRRRSKIEGVYDITTRDGAQIRVKPFAATDKRIQNSQKKIVRESMKKTINEQATKSTLSEFVNIIIDGKLGSELYKNCKNLYPVKRIEIYKTEVITQPTIKIEDKPKKKKEETEKVEDKKEEKPTKKKEEKKTGEIIEIPEEPKEKLVEEEKPPEKKEKTKEEKPKKKEEKIESEKTVKKTKKPTTKKTTNKNITKIKTLVKKKKAAKKEK
ncbi:MAG: 30S ribosomal protein S3ae [Candidatus Thermoplasmatota archaeon]|nr:30S ribosomal protein S3ae [Candidatus Thermoplasmatota archaeon]